MANWTELLKSRKSILFIVICTAVVYINSLSNGFVWDDKVLLVPNDAYKKLDFGRIFFTKVNSLEYLPFRDLSYVIDYQVWGMNPFGFHLTNLLLYLISLFVLFNMVKNIAILSGEKEWEFMAFWTTLIFALHPLHTEVVNFIHGRNTLLAALFLFLSFNLCLEGIQKQKNILVLLSVVTFVMAVFSKAIVIFYPFFLAAIIFLIPDAIISIRKKVILLAVFFAVDIFAVWVHFINAAETNIMNINMIMYGNDNWGLRIAKALQIPFFYARMFILPYPLSVDYMVPFMFGGIVLRSVLAGTVIAVALSAVWLQRKKQPILYIGTAWIVLSLGPVLNIFPTSPMVADRYAYLPVLGFSILLAYLITNLAAKRRIFLYASLVMILLWGIINFNRNFDWCSDITLWRAEAAMNPKMDMTNLAVALWDNRQYDEALSCLEKGKGMPGAFRYYQYKGKYLFLVGDYQDAIQHYKEAINRGGDAQKEIHVELGVIYERAGLERQAIEAYLKGIDMEGSDPFGKYEKKAREGIERIRRKLMPEIEGEQRLAQQEPMNFMAQAVYALSLHSLGLYENAEKFYKKALDINPLSWEVWYNLGITRMKQRRHADAIQSFGKALVINPGNKDAFNNAGTCYMSLRNYSQAIKYYERALALDPNFFYASFNLGRVYFNTGNREMSHKYFLMARALANENSGMQARVDQYLKELK